MQSFNTTRACGALLWAAALAAAGNVQAAAPAGVITGTITDKATAAPIAIESYPNVILYQCLNEGDTFCGGFTGFAEADASGAYSIATTDIPSGRYQLLAGATDYSYLYSGTFDLAPGDGLKKKLQLSLLPVSFGEVRPCTTVTAAGWCDFQYTVTNRTGADKTVQVWAQLNGHTNMPATDTGYSSGNGNYKPMQLTLPAGQSQVVTQSVYLGVRDSGSYSLIALYASPVGQPNQTIGFYDAGKLTVRDSGVSAQSAVEMHKAEAAQRAAKTASGSALQAGPAASAPGAFIVGTLTAADTGLPIDLSLSPRIRLVLCGEAADAYCSSTGGEWVYLGETGEYRLNTKAIGVGRYQIDAQARSGYGITRSAAFDAPTTSSSRVNLVLPKPLLTLSNIAGCGQVIATDSSCTLEFDATNTTGDKQTLWIWAQVNGYLAGSPVGVAIYDAGSAKSMKPQTLEIEAGQTLHLTQLVTLSKSLKAGAEMGLQVYVGSVNDPAHADSATSLGSVVIQAAP